MAVESKKFGLTDDISLETIVKRVERVLQRDYSLETQYAVIDGDYVLQTSDADDADNSNSRPAITARFLIEGDDLKVTTGEGLWSKKLGESQIGWFLALPPLVRAEYGSPLPEGIKDEIFGAVEYAIQNGDFEETVSCLDSTIQRPVPEVEPEPEAESYEDVAKVICSNCGTENKAKVNFCKRCGHRMKTACPHCGAPIGADSIFCVECGNRIK